MALAERQQRPRPKRAGPKRAVLDRTDAVNGKPVAAAGPGSPTGDEAVVDAAVAAAYRVVEDNVQEGRRAAERLRAAADDPHEPPANAKAVASRLIHITRDLGAAWVDLVVAVLREPEVRAVVDRITLQNRPAPATMSAGATAAAITHRIRSRKPVEVTLSALPPLDPAAPPGIGGLHALDGALPPIREVRLAVNPGGGLELQIVVPDDQIADIYTGAIVSIATRLPIGTLTVRIFE